MGKVFPKIDLETKEVPLEKGQWLKDALLIIGVDCIPSNVLLDKTITGIGATSLELSCTRHSIIIEPTLPVIQDKAQGNPYLPVYQGCTPADVVAYLQREDVGYKKILTTPESFWKIKRACGDLGIAMYDYFFCLFDECEKLTQDNDYRKKITKPVKDFFQFQSKAFVSATPLEVSDPRFRGFVRIKIIPQYDYREDLRLVITNAFMLEAKKVLLEDLKDSPCVFVFLNTTDGIYELMDYLGIKEESKVFCSDASVEKLKRYGFANVESQFQEPLKKYNFLTCRFYSALDINVGVLPDVVLLTDLFRAEHSMIDPFTEAVQIQGRFRTRHENGKRFNSLTHISTVNPMLNIRSMEELDAELSVYKEHYENLQESYEQEEDKHKKQALQKEMGKSAFADFMAKNDDGSQEVDYFTIDNYYNAEQVKGCYKNLESLEGAYGRTGYFNVAREAHYHVLGDEKRIALKQRMSFVKRCKLILAILVPNAKENIETCIELFREIQDFDFIYEVYKELGEGVFEEKEYRRQELGKALDNAKNEKKKYSPEILAVIHDSFPLRISKPMEELQRDLQGIYKRFGIDCKVRLKTIENYFEASPSYDKPPYTYKLKAFKF